MSFRERIEVTVDLLTDKVSSGLKNLKKDFQAAETGGQKFKVVTSSAFDVVKQNAAQFALAGGAALVTFGLKAAMSAQDYALSMGKAADATGLAVDKFSRWNEVAGDIGVSTESVEKTFGFMNKTLGKSPALFDQLGVSIGHAEDGSVDASETFLNVVDRLNAISDPAQKARTASLLLGRGWQDMAELIEQGSSKLSDSLKSVSDAKVITDEERQNAEKFREVLDNLTDKFEDISIEVGQAVLPALTQVAEVLGDIADIKIPFTGTGVIGGLSKLAEKTFDSINPLDNLQSGWKRLTDSDSSWPNRVAGGFETLLGWIPGIGEGISDINDAIFGSAAASDELKKKTAEAATAAEEAAGSWATQRQAFLDAEAAARGAADAATTVDVLTAAADRSARKAEEMDRAWQALFDTLSDEESLDGVQDGFDGIKTAAEESMQAQLDAQAAYADAAKGVEGAAELAIQKEKDAKVAAEAYSDQVRQQKADVASYAKEVLGLPVERTTELLAMIDQNKYDEVLRMLNILSANRTMSLSIIAKGGMGFTINPGGSQTGKRAVGATGGIVTRATDATIGEAGPEAVIPLNQMPGASPLGALGGGGVTVHFAPQITIQVAPGNDMQHIEQGLLRSVRQGSPFVRQLLANAGIRI